MIHPKIDRQSKLLENTWRLLTAELNNIGTIRGTVEDWYTTWQLLVSEAKVLRSWLVESHPIYDQILQLHFAEPPRLLGDFIQLKTIGGQSNASTIGITDMDDQTHHVLELAVGKIFPVCPTLILEIKQDLIANELAAGHVGGNVAAADVHPAAIEQAQDNEIEIVYELINIS